MAELIEDRVREIVKEEMAKTPVNVARYNVVLELDGKKIGQAITDEIRKQIGEKL